MKKLVATLFFICIAGVCFAGPELSVDDGYFDLGMMQEGKVYPFLFRFENSGDEDLKVDVIQVSCGCVKIVEPAEPVVVSPGEELAVHFNFDTTGFQGDTVKYIYINSNDPLNPLLTIKLLTYIEAQESVFLNRFEQFSGWTVIGAGLVDGVNPCAFTVLIFFLSFLSFVGYQRRQIIVLGSVFILTVFLTYLAIGLGIFEFLRILPKFELVSRAIYIATACLAIVLGVLSLRDWWVFNKTKDPEKIMLKLPGMVKKQIQGVIREKTDTRGKTTQEKQGIIKLVLTALSCGFIVSLLESVCTGQLYVPTIVYVLGIPELKVKAWAYLVLYNVMFIVPLVAIFLFALFGVTSQGFAKVARLHLAKIKLITAFVFFLLGFFLLFIVKH
ncbi:DUF1573 domain-containing protein [Candidatus Omnitrophota bacterium]